MKKNKNTMVDLLLLGLTIVLMILFDVIFYPADADISSGISNATVEQAKTDEWFYRKENNRFSKASPDTIPYLKVKLFQNVQRYQKAGDLNSALDACNEVIANDTSDAKGYYLRAMINTLLDRKAEAVNDYNKSLKLNPDLFQAYLNRGLLNIKENKPMNAFLDITSAVKINPVKSLSFLFSRSLKGVF